MTTKPTPLNLLERGLNAVLSLDDDAAGALGDIHGSVLAFAISATAIRILVRCDEQGVRLSENPDGDADIELSGPPLALLALAVNANKPDSMLPRGVTLKGDVAMLQRWRRALGRLDLDIEELLSVWLGDSAARLVVKSAGGLWDWHQHTADTLLQDVAEYISEETHMVAVSGELNHFSQGVECIRDDVERLTSRVKRLQGLGGKEP